MEDRDSSELLELVRFAVLQICLFIKIKVYPFQTSTNERLWSYREFQFPYSKHAVNFLHLHAAFSCWIKRTRICITVNSTFHGLPIRKQLIAFGAVYSITHSSWQGSKEGARGSSEGSFTTLYVEMHFQLLPCLHLRGALLMLLLIPIPKN